MFFFFSEGVLKYWIMLVRLANASHQSRLKFSNVDRVDNICITACTRWCPFHLLYVFVLRKSTLCTIFFARKALANEKKDRCQSIFHGVAVRLQSTRSNLPLVLSFLFQKILRMTPYRTPLLTNVFAIIVFQY